MIKDKPLILLVDDDPDFLEIFSIKLQASGFITEVAQGGKAALEKAKAVKPDLMVLDLQMPDLTGAEVLDTMKADPELKNTKVIFLTNYGDPVESDVWIDEKFAREVGAINYIRKSGDLDKIVAEIRETVKATMFAEPEKSE
jgi:CheY-like chemotaxis protein